MKKKTYNNVLKATGMIQKKGYSFEEASQMALKIFDENENNDVEFYINKILTKNEFEHEQKIWRQNIM